MTGLSNSDTVTDVDRLEVFAPFHSIGERLLGVQAAGVASSVDSIDLHFGYPESCDAFDSFIYRPLLS
jgi:hypothetical protein